MPEEGLLLGKEGDEPRGRALPEVWHQRGIRGGKEKPEVLEGKTATKADKRQKETSKRCDGRPEDRQ